ncbi:MAG: hypothetical protein NVV57_12030 [Demequina sp.]|nr:hypothetical protein [Demequina sp.]
MSDAGAAFRMLRDQAGAAFDAPAMHSQLDAAEHRVERARVWRAVMSTGAVLVFACVAVFAVQALLGDRSSPMPAHSPSPSPSVTPDIADVLALPCTVATVVPGNPIERSDGGILRGFEGWFNSTYAEPGGCDSSENWNEEIWLMANHPDTVWINTSDNTVIEAYFRTSKDALGIWAHMDGKTIADPDPAWPADSAVLIDAHTGEVLLTSPLSDYLDLTESNSSG